MGQNGMHKTAGWGVLGSSCLFEACSSKLPHIHIHIQIRKNRRGSGAMEVRRELVRVSKVDRSCEETLKLTCVLAAVLFSLGQTLEGRKRGGRRKGREDGRGGVEEACAGQRFCFWW
jgi:hypothetical protein